MSALECAQNPNTFRSDPVLSSAYVNEMQMVLNDAEIMKNAQNPASTIYNQLQKGLAYMSKLSENAMSQQGLYENVQTYEGHTENSPWIPDSGFPQKMVGQTVMINGDIAQKMIGQTMMVGQQPVMMMPVSMVNQNMIPFHGHMDMPQQFNPMMMMQSPMGMGQMMMQDGMPQMGYMPEMGHESYVQMPMQDHDGAVAHPQHKDAQQQQKGDDSFLAKNDFLQQPLPYEFDLPSSQLRGDGQIEGPSA